jgi:hypothetical protein
VTLLRLSIPLAALFVATSACASGREIASCDLVAKETQDEREALAAGITIENAPIGGRDILTLWLCSSYECAPTLRVRDQTGLAFRWRADGALSVATASLEPELLGGADYFRQEIVLVGDLATDQRGSSDAGSGPAGVGRLGGVGHSRCVFGDSPRWADRAILSD